MSTTVKIEITSEDEYKVKRTLDKVLNNEENQGCDCTEVTGADRIRVLRQTTTKELVDELKRRDGVYAVDIPPCEKADISELVGPAIVLKIID